MHVVAGMKPDLKLAVSLAEISIARWGHYNIVVLSLLECPVRKESGREPFLPGAPLAWATWLSLELVGRPHFDTSSAGRSVVGI